MKHSRVAISVSLVITSLVLFVLDPYTYGGVGGDRQNLIVHAWQPAATVLLVLLNGIGVFRVHRDVGLRIFAAELMLFVALNSLYVLRDGWDTRTTIGNVGSRLPLVWLLLGLFVRLGHIGILVWRNRSASPAGS